MVDRGEKIPFNERKKTAKLHFEDFKKDTKKKFSGKGSSIMQLLILVMIVVIFAQSSGMINKMDKLLNESSETAHEIYDDSAIIKAYKTGNTDKLDAKELFVYETMSEVIDELITDGMSDYDKEKAIYDWQVAWVHYNSENLNPISEGSNETHTPYGVLRSHSAICVGNATTFKLFMDALDIPCMIIHSTEYGEHAWDIVQLDGEWYHVDVTFDGTNTQEPSYSSFNVPDSIKDDGSWPWDHDVIPAANGTKYCYMYMNAELLDDFYAIPAALKEKTDSKDGNFYFKLKDSTGFTRNIADYIADNLPVENGDVFFNGSYAMNGEVVYMYSVYDYSSSSDTAIPDDVKEKLGGIINELLYGPGEDFDLTYDDANSNGKDLWELTSSAIVKG